MNFRGYPRQTPPTTIDPTDLFQADPINSVASRKDSWTETDVHHSIRNLVKTAPPQKQVHIVHPNPKVRRLD